MTDSSRPLLFRSRDWRGTHPGGEWTWNHRDIEPTCFFGVFSNNKPQDIDSLIIAAVREKIALKLRHR